MCARRFTVLRLFVCLVFSSIIIGQVSAAPPVSTAYASVTPMEAAGKLRSLSQRQAKLYLQMRLGIEAELSERWLAEAVRSFDENAEIVGRAAQGDASSKRIAGRIATQWESLRQTLTSPLDPVKALRVAAEAEAIAISAQALAVRFDLAQESPMYRLVDLASRNDMLAQRLARIYMQMRAGQGGAGAEVDLLQTRKEFSAGLNELMLAAANTPAVKNILELARQQWLFLELAVSDRSKKFDYTRRDVATTSERISQMMNETSRVYTQLAGGGGEALALLDR
jgi:hypothetical protein